MNQICEFRYFLSFLSFSSTVAASHVCNKDTCYLSPFSPHRKMDSRFVPSSAQTPNSSLALLSSAHSLFLFSKASSSMQHRDQPRSNVSLTGSVISPLHFYDQFKLARDITLAQVPHPQFRFLLSGFACAIALAEHSELDKEDDEIRELLVKKPISSHDLVSSSFLLEWLNTDGLTSGKGEQVVESLIIPTFPINPEERRRYSHSLEQIGLGYWREVCEALVSFYLSRASKVR